MTTICNGKTTQYPPPKKWFTMPSPPSTFAAYV
jgi:hypothetical protein